MTFVNIRLALIVLLCGSAAIDIVANERQAPIVFACMGLTAIVAFVSLVSHRE